MQNMGKYQILEKIGTGGFGEVYKGRDPYIKRHVAVKTCLTDDQEIRNRFFREAEIAGNLHHRNVTTIYDFGVENDIPFLVQEYLTGEDLDHKIKRKDFMPYAEKAYYLIQIARGLAYAHSQGVIHRDIKPANIRILEDGLAKIMDFGIAKLAQHQTSLTQTGMTLGTAAYLAPEQIRGADVDHRTDIFSFGVLAYELLTFERPFKGEQISAVIYQILNHEPTPVRQHVASVPEEMAQLVEQCLSKDPSNRCDDGAALLRALEDVQKAGRDEASGSAPSIPTEAGPPPGVPTVPVGPAPASSEASGSGSVSGSGSMSGTGTLDQLELTSVNLEESRALPKAKASTSSTIAVSSKPSSPILKYAALGFIALAALAAGMWLGNPGRQTPSEPANDPTAVGTPADAAGSGEAASTTATTPPSSEDPAPTGTVTEDVVPPPDKAPPPPAPPPPANGTLVFRKPAWTASMVARTGGRSRELIRDRSIDLPPGQHEVTFAVDDGGFKTSATVTVTVTAGARQVVDIPIVQPGVLTVRPFIGRPNGEVTVGGLLVGESPVSRHFLAPGNHQLMISPLDASGGSPIEQQISVLSGKETLITFNLDTGNVSEKLKDDS